MGSIGNPFSNTVVKYSDKEVLKIARSPNDYSYKLYEACRDEVGKRGIEDSIDIKSIKPKEPNYLSIIKTNLSNGAKIEDCETYLLNEGLENERILLILDKAARTAPLKPQGVKVKKESSGVSIWLVFLVMFSVIRLIYSLAT